MTSDPPAADFWLHSMPGHMVRRLHQQIVGDFAAAVARTPALAQLTSMQFAALAAIAHAPGRDQATIARLIGCDKVTAGKLFDRMSERGWLDRQPSPADRRARLLVLTPAGRALFRRARPIAEIAPLAVLDRLSARERKVFIELLRRLAFSTPAQ